MGDTARNPIVTFLWQYVLERVVLFSPRSVWPNALHPQGVTCELPNLSEKSPSTRRGVSTSPPIEPLRLCQHIRSHCLLNSLLSSFIWDRWKVTFRTTRVCKIKLKSASKIRANFQKQLAQCHFGLLAVLGVWCLNTTTRLYLLTSTRKEMRTSSQIFLPSQISNQYNNDSAFVFIFYKKPPWSHKLCT